MTPLNLGVLTGVLPRVAPPLKISVDLEGSITISALVDHKKRRVVERDREANKSHVFASVQGGGSRKQHTGACVAPLIVY